LAFPTRPKRDAIAVRGLGDLPVLAQRGSVRARGLRPRRAAPRLALSVRCVLPSASDNSVGALK
jgi:hypothetical protein